MPLRYVLNGNGVHAAGVEDSDYIEIRDDVAEDDIVSAFLQSDEEFIEDSTIRVVSVAKLVAIADATFAYLSAQENGNMEGVYERVELRDLLEKAGYPFLIEDDNDGDEPYTDIGTGISVPTRLVAESDPEELDT